MVSQPETSRRTLIGAALSLTAAAGAANAAAPAAKPAATAPATPPTPAAPSFTAPSTPKPLPFNPAKLDGISEKLIQSHWENNYSGALKALGAVKARLNDMRGAKDVPPYIYNDLKREHLMRTGSVVLHELYFDNLGGNGQASAETRSMLAGGFGSYDAWEAEFRTMANGLGGGSGWVMLGYNGHTKQLENYWLADHAHGPAATTPLLILDMYEHSYQIDYGAAAAKYVDAFFKNINWDKVAERYSSVMLAQNE